MAEDRKLTELNRKRTLGESDKTYLVSNGVSYYMTGGDLKSEITKDGVAWGTISGNIDNQTDLKNKFDVIDGELATIEANPGSTSADQELMGIRTAYNGYVYDTAGNAVRGQVTPLYDAMNAMKTGFDGVEYPSPVEMVQGEDEKIFANLNIETKKIHNLKIENSEYIQGVRNSSLVVNPRTDRCTSKRVFHMYPGDSIIIDNIASGQRSVIATSSGYDSGWRTYRYVYIAAVETMAFVVVSTSSGSGTIAPSDVTTTIEIVDHTSAIIMNKRNITNNSNAIANLQRTLAGDKICLYPEYTQGAGSINSSNKYIINANAYRISTSDLIDMTGITSLDITIKTGYRIYLLWFDASKTFVIGRGWYTENVTRTVESKYLAYSIASVDDANIVTVDNFDNNVTIAYTAPSKDSVPEYWNDPLATAIETIQNHEEVTDAQGDSFVFITDTHWEKNAKHSSLLIKSIMDKTNVNKVFFGGDVLTLSPTQAAALAIGREYYRSYGDIPVYSALGNHDVNNNESTYGSEAYLTYPQVYSYMFKKIESRVKDMPKIGDTNGDVNRNMYYYLDNETQKIRYIFLNNARARIGTVQKTWFQNIMNACPSGWTIIIFAHIYWSGISDGNPVVVTYGSDISDAIDEVYDTMAASVAALIVGHCHFDYSITTTKGYPVIATTTDCYYLSDTELSPTMTLGTDTEQAFDVFSIDTKNKKIYADRIGAGTSREFTYA